MHYTVKKTLKQLRDADNHYLVCVKPNQARLYQWIESQWHTAQPSSHYQQHQLEHGRQVQRVIQVFEELGEFAQHWTDLRCLLSIERRGIRGGKAFEERHYYISSYQTTAQSFATLIRQHWHIENQLHWVLDVTFNEDHAPQGGNRAAVNWSIVRNFFITLARRAGFRSMATAKRKWMNRFDRVFPLLQ
jgi:predicted transposase YbfD/YdcC